MPHPYPITCKDPDDCAGASCSAYGIEYWKCESYPTPTMPIREKALAAWNKAQAELQEAAARNAAEAHAVHGKWLAKHFGDADLIAHLAAEGTEARVRASEGGYHLEIAFQYPQCGCQAWSGSIYTWSGLGELLHAPTSAPWDHRCAGPGGGTAPTTRRDKLTDAITEAICEALN